MQAATVSPWVLIVTSAAVGALLSSLVTVINAYFERRSRRRELLFKEALLLAHNDNDVKMQIAMKTGESAAFPNPIYSAERYLGWLEELFASGKLPADARRMFEEGKRKIGEQRAREQNRGI
ncbi:MAG TPA: hypothetical protein VF006_24145 [Longimicrobium sp.]